MTPQPAPARARAPSTASCRTARETTCRAAAPWNADLAILSQCHSRGEHVNSMQFIIINTVNMHCHVIRATVHCLCFRGTGSRTQRGTSQRPCPTPTVREGAMTGVSGRSVRSAGADRVSGTAPEAVPPSGPGALAPSMPLSLTRSCQAPTLPAAQRPSGPAAQRPSGPAAQRPSGPAAQRPSGPAA